ncbi:MAG: cyclase family protein [Thermoguttaceae bacterium]|jgi:kynurenine formamidase
MKLLDLSQPIYKGIPVYPGDPLFESRPFAEHETDGYRGTRYVVGSHLGTHLDAPFHAFVDGETLDSFPIDFFDGAAACLDLAPLVGPDSSRYRDRLDASRPAALSVDDLEPFEPIFDVVPIVVFRTGWSVAFGDNEYYCDFPSLSPELCDWLADYPTLRILGLETPSLVAQLSAHEAPEVSDVREKFDPELGEFLPERVPDPALASALSAPETSENRPRPFDEIELHADSECHRILLGRRPPILILEGLVNLESLPQYSRPENSAPVVLDDAKRFELSCYPLPIRGADGAPARVVARIPEP